MKNPFQREKQSTQSIQFTINNQQTKSTTVSNKTQMTNKQSNEKLVDRRRVRSKASSQSINEKVSKQRTAHYRNNRNTEYNFLFNSALHNSFNRTQNTPRLLPRKHTIVIAEMVDRKLLTPLYTLLLYDRKYQTMLCTKLYRKKKQHAAKINVPNVRWIYVVVLIICACCFVFIFFLPFFLLLLHQPYLLLHLMLLYFLNEQQINSFHTLLHQHSDNRKTHTHK